VIINDQKPRGKYSYAYEPTRAQRKAQREEGAMYLQGLLEEPPITAKSVTPIEPEDFHCEDGFLAVEIIQEASK
jgi:hypothetical protein